MTATVSTSRPLLALVMMVRDEAHTIERTLESVRGVCDHGTVFDTGSTDETREVVVRVGGVIWPGTKVLWEGAFTDYADTRNRVLDFERGRADSAAFALSLSADEVLVGGAVLRAYLAAYAGEEDAFLVEVRTPTGVFYYPRVLRVGGPWRYEGAIHEEPVHQVERGRRPVARVSDCYVKYAPTDPERHARRLRERDVPLLLRQLREAGTVAITRARLVSLLAQTREEIAASINASGNLVEASQEMFSALGYYAFLSMDEAAPAEARRHAAWKYLNVAEALGIYLPREMVPRLMRVVRDDSNNPAAAYMFARHMADVDGEGRVRGDAREGLRAAQAAARVARNAVSNPERSYDPHGLLWRSHYLAAFCARALGHGLAARKSAEAGIAGGGPREAFETFLR